MAISVSNVGSLGSSFLSWWLDELAALWQPVGSALRSGPKTAVLDTSGGAWVLRSKKGSRFHDLIQFEPPAAGPVRAFDAALKKAKVDRAHVRLLIAEGKCLRRRIDMPAIGDADLRKALYFEVERQTPFRPEDVYFDYRIVSRQPESKRVSVELLTAPRAAVDPVLDRAKGLGLAPAGVDVVSSASPGGIGVNLLSPEKSASGWSVYRLAPIVLLGALAFAVLYVPVSQLATADDTLAAQVEEEGAKAKLTLAKRAELENAARAAAFLDERKKKMLPVLSLLDGLTKALPDNTWLTTLTQNEQDIKISGYSAAAAELISLIDAAPDFKNPTFSSPVVQDPQKNVERFDISFETVPGGKQQ